jgi:hypothetical protein
MNFLGHVCTYRYLVNGQWMEVWDTRTWEFFDQDGKHLNDGVVWHVDDNPLPTYEEVQENIIRGIE